MLKWTRRILRWLVILGAAIIGVVVFLYFALFVVALFMPPLQPVAMTSTPNPAPAYDAAVARFDQIVADYKAQNDLQELCYPQLLSHGQKTAVSIVLLHGLTACPYQYAELGKQYFDLGYNVYIPLLPRHGLADRVANNLADLTAEELMAAVDPAVDIAAGLGDQVVVQGISLGGNVAAAATQFRSDVTLGMPISPAIGLRALPASLAPAAARLLLGLPDIYVWWDPINKDQFQATSGYPGYSSHGLAEIIRFGLAVLARSEQQAPASTRQLLVTNLGDPAISLQAADQLGRAWRRHGGDLSTYRFPLLPWLPHDIISNDAVGARTEETYPVLLDLVRDNLP